MDEVHSLDLVYPVKLKIIFSIDVEILGVVFCYHATCTIFAGSLVVRPIPDTSEGSVITCFIMHHRYFRAFHPQQVDAWRQLLAYPPSEFLYARMVKPKRRPNFQPSLTES